MTGEGSGTMKLFLVENLTPGVPASETAGLVIAAENDSSQFQATSIQFAGVLDFLSPGNMGLIGLETWPDGFFGKAIYDLFFMTFITFESPQLIFEVEIETNPAAWIGNLSGGTGEFTWAVTTGSLPPGLSLDGEGSITGVPQEHGAFNFSVEATSGGISDTTSLQIQVVLPALEHKKFRFEVQDNVESS